MKLRKFMPEVDGTTDFRAVFTRARQMASFEGRRADGQLARRVAIVLPSRQIALQECPAAGTAENEMIQSVEKILLSSQLCNVVAVAFNALEAAGGVQDVVRAIPFLGFLMGFAYIGHNVVVFEGHPSALVDGLSEADLLLVDAEMAPFLQKDWLDVAFRAMRTPKVYLFRPSGQVQQVLPK